jgi:release factor glutamine methyltransferase
MHSVYLPAEDSFFLANFVRDIIKKEKPVTIMDMGSGSGIQSETAMNSGINEKNIILIDLNQEAITLLKNKFPNSKVIQSNLFQNVKEKADLIIFNPPYLPISKYDKGKDTTGGKKGSETINLFLNQAKNHLNKNGRILLLTSDKTKGINWPSSNSVTRKLLGKKRLFFEELYVWRLT